MVTNLQTVKDALQIKGDSKDTAIQTWIPLAEQWIRGYCNLRDDEEIPASYEMNAIRMIQYNLETKSGVSSYSISRASFSFSNDYPADVTRGLKRRLKWN